jgi:hypothetical protein
MCSQTNGVIARKSIGIGGALDIGAGVSRAETPPNDGK